MDINELQRKTIIRSRLNKKIICGINLLGLLKSQRKKVAFTLMDLGNNIRSLRKSRKSIFKEGKPMMQKELAEKAGVPASSLCNIENGKYKNPTWEILSKIAHALECDISEFFISDKTKVSPSHIALSEMIEMIIEERLESILKERMKK